MLRLSEGNKEAGSEPQSARILLWIYSLCYCVGAITIKLLKKAAGAIAVPAVAVCRALHTLFKAAAAPFVSFKSNVIEYTGSESVLKSKKGLGRLLCFIRLSFKYMTRNGMKKGVAYVAPVLAAAVFAGSVYSFNAKTFAVEVSYKGNVIAYVEDESDFTEAAQIIASKIADDDIRSSVDMTASFKLVAVSADKITTGENIGNILLSSITPALQEASGLYIDDKFIAASSTDAEIRSALGAVLDPYLAGEGVEKVSFNNNVTIKSGYFKAENVKSGADIKTLLDTPVLTKEIYVTSDGETLSSISETTGTSVDTITALNPNIEETPAEGSNVIVEVPRMLYSVKVVKSESFEQTIGFDSIEVQDDTIYAGTKKVSVRGKEGKSLVTEEVVLVDGVEVSRNHISTQVISEPVTEQITVGTKNVVKSQAQALVEGSGDVIDSNMVSPIEMVDRMYISSYYGDDRGHKGWDFAAPKGTKIFAADDGVVVSVNASGSGYGLHFVIDHGNGLRTLYAHCDSINVTVGQTVSRGETIAAVGNTGRSTGNHLHFEILVNGAAVDPAPYLAGIIN